MSTGFVGKGPEKDAEVRYVGPYAEAHVPEIEKRCAHGESIVVPADVAARMCAQPTNWEPVEAPKVKAPVAKAKAASVVEDEAEEAAADEEQ